MTMQPNPISNKEAADFLRSHDNFLIINHIRPDGDAVGCAAALCLGLRALGKTASVWKNPQTTDRYIPYLSGLEVTSEPEKACLITVDTASETMFPLNGRSFTGRVSLAIDHHPSNSFYATVTDVHPDAAACGEIILEILKLLGISLTKEIADALYVAVSTDTGCFKYSNVTPATLHTAAELKAAGADTYAINKVMFDTKTIARLRVEALLTSTVEFYAAGLVAVCTLENSKLDEIGATEDDIDNISGFPRSIEGVGIGVMIRDLREGGSKVSLRTEAGYNATRICASLGGGGHAAAAGATVQASLAETRRMVLKAIADSGVAL